MSGALKNFVAVEAAIIDTLSLIKKRVTGQIRLADLHIAQGVNRSLQGLLSVKFFCVLATLNELRVKNCHLQILRADT